MLILILAFFIVLTIILGGLLIYNKIDTKENKDENQTVENKKDNTETNNISILNFYSESIAIVNDGNVYVNINIDEEELNNLFSNDEYHILIETRNNYKEYLFNNLTYILKNNTHFTGMKLNITNVNYIYQYTPQDTSSKNYGLILLNNDKTISVISLFSLINGIVNTTKIDNLTNVEKIITEDDMITYAVLDNGNKINLIDYIPNDYNLF